MNTKNSLTVVQVLPALESGGVERGTVEIARALKQRGHRAVVIAAGGELVDELVRSGADFIDWDMSRKSPLTLKYVFKLRQLIKSYNVDVLHVRSRMTAWLARLACKTLPKKQRPHFITTIHNPYPVNAYSEIMTKGDRVIAVSSTIRQYIIDSYPKVNPDTIQVILRCINLEEFPYGFKPDQTWLDAWYGQYPVLKGRQVITILGSLKPSKGHQDFIRLMSVLRKKGIDVCGVVVGEQDDSEQAYIDELLISVREHDLQDRIIFTGKREDDREIYAVSDIVMFLSKDPEPVGLPAIKALSLGVPVLGYDHGDIGVMLREVFPQGGIPVGKTLNLAGKTIAMLENKPEIPREHIFDIAIMVGATIDLYEKLYHGD